MWNPKIRRRREFAQPTAISATELTNWMMPERVPQVWPGQKDAEQKTWLGRKMAGRKMESVCI